MDPDYDHFKLGQGNKRMLFLLCTFMDISLWVLLTNSCSEGSNSIGIEAIVTVCNSVESFGSVFGKPVN